MKNSNKDLIISCIEVNADEVLTGLRNRLVSYDDIRNNNDIELINSYLIAKSWFLSQIKLKKETLKEECTVDYEFNYDKFICYATIEVLSLEEKQGTNKTDPNFRTETNTFYQIKYTKMSNLRIDEHRELCVKSLDLLHQIEASKMSYEQLLYRIQIEDLKPAVTRYLTSPRSKFVESKDESYRKMQTHINDYNKLIESWPKI